jgi:hypothetical protein|tara:strand:- start:75 stop:683 length:609 start_codon:yes stop_codon:yes gene_type:complete
MGFFDLDAAGQRKAFSKFMSTGPTKPKKEKKKVKVNDDGKWKAKPLKSRTNTNVPKKVIETGGKTGMTSKPIDTTGRPPYPQKTKPSYMKKVNKPEASTMNTSSYEPTTISTSPYGKSKPFLSLILNRPSGNEVPGNRAVTKKAPVADSMYGYANQGNKGNSVSNAKKPNYKKAVQADTKKKKKRAQGRNQMRNARASMGFK